jgi:Xaa-Pro dipeptidase
MLLDRRRFSGLLAGFVGGAVMPRPSLHAVAPADPCHLPSQIEALTPMTAGVRPIGDAERQARIERARALMTEAKIDAILIEPGATMEYFTGVQWGLSERPFVAVIPARGELAWVCPGFEEARGREQIRHAADVRVWQEDESPAAVIAGILRDRGAAAGRIGVEERVRYFIAEAARKEAAAAEFVSATPVTAGCRMIKSAAELALMQRASDITIAAFRATFATMKAGMLNTELVENMTAAMQRLGGTDPWTLALFGPASALPHGTTQPQRLKEGDVVLVDSGCAVEGYQSDVTRTTVFGKPSARQTEVWNLERRAQDAAFAAARVGASCESVDAAARQVITSAGFGPGYAVPGLPHRTGHGIGMEGHEWTYFVRGNTTPIRPGMCFSDEPTIAIPGEFGVRLEDCLYITDAGPKFFTPQSESIDKPVP